MGLCKALDSVLSREAGSHIYGVATTGRVNVACRCNRRTVGKLIPEQPMFELKETYLVVINTHTEFVHDTTVLPGPWRIRVSRWYGRLYLDVSNLTSLVVEVGKM